MDGWVIGGFVWMDYCIVEIEEYWVLMLDG